MRFFGIICTVVAGLIFTTSVDTTNAQDKKAEERPRLFKGGLIKRFEDLQERMQKDREERQKEQQKTREAVAKKRQENLRDFQKELKKGFEGPFNLFSKKPETKSTGPDKNKLNSPEGLAPLENPDFNLAPIDDPRPTSGNGAVELGVEVKPGGITSSGLLVEKVDRRGPAGLAGLKTSDRITSVGGSPIKKIDDLQMILEAFVPGDRTELEIVRKGKKKKLLIEFPGGQNQQDSLALNRPQMDLNGPQDPQSGTEELPSPNRSRSNPNQEEQNSSRSSRKNAPPVLPLLEGPAQNQPSSPAANNNFRAGIGVTAVAVDPVLFAREQLNVRQGAYLDDVEKESAAEKAGLQRGDVVIALDGRKVDSAVGMAELVQSYQPGEKAQLLYYRKNRLRRTEIEMDRIAVSQFDSLAQQARPVPTIPAPSQSTAKRNGILGELSSDFPRLKRVEQMIDQFSASPQGQANQQGSVAKGREVQLENEVQSLRNQLRGQDRQIKDLTQKLTLIEKLLAEKKSKDKQSDRK